MGLIFLTVGVGLHRADSRRTASATGTVVGVEERRDTSRDGSGRIYYPVVEFTTQEGRLIRFHSSSGTSGGYERGQSIRVVYDPTRPDDVALGSDGIFAAAFGLGGALAAGLGGFLSGGALAYSRWRAGRSA